MISSSRHVHSAGWMAGSPGGVYLAAISAIVLVWFGILLSSSSIWVLVPALFATACLLALLRPRLQSWLLLLFLILAWCPQFSQVDIDAWTAAEAPTVYNYRPIPAVTASVFDYLFAGITAVWICKLLSRKSVIWRTTPFVGTMAAFFFVWLFNFLHGLARGNETYYALREFRNGAYFVLSYLMVVTLFSESQATRILKIIVGAAFVIGCYGVIRHELGIGREFLDHIIVFYDIADSMLLFFAMLLITAFVIERALTRWQSIVAALLTVPMALTFLFSYRRGAWVGFAAGLFFLVLLYPGQGRFRRAVLQRVGVSVLVVATLLLAFPAMRNQQLEFLGQRIQSIFDTSEDSSNVFRILDAMNALYTFAHHPIIGVGAGGRYDIEYSSTEPVTMEFMEHVSTTSHDGYLYVLFKSGLLGFTAYGLIFVRFLKKWLAVRTRIFNPARRAAFMAIGAMVIATLVTNITEPLSDLPRSSSLLAFIMGIGAVAMRGEMHRGQWEPAPAPGPGKATA